MPRNSDALRDVLEDLGALPSQQEEEEEQREQQTEPAGGSGGSSRDVGLTPGTGGGSSDSGDSSSDSDGGSLADEVTDTEPAGSSGGSSRTTTPTPGGSSDGPPEAAPPSQPEPEPEPEPPDPSPSSGGSSRTTTPTAGGSSTSSPTPDPAPNPEPDPAPSPPSGGSSDTTTPTAGGGSSGSSSADSNQSGTNTQATPDTSPSPPEPEPPSTPSPDPEQRTTNPGTENPEPQTNTEPEIDDGSGSGSSGSSNSQGTTQPTSDSGGQESNNRGDFGDPTQTDANSAEVVETLDANPSELPDGRAEDLAQTYARQNPGEPVAIAPNPTGDGTRILVGEDARGVANVMAASEIEQTLEEQANKDLQRGEDFSIDEGEGGQPQTELTDSGQQAIQEAQRQEAINRLDEQTPGVDVSRDDVRFVEENGNTRVELTGDARDMLETQQAAAAVGGTTEQQREFVEDAAPASSTKREAVSILEDQLNRDVDPDSLSQQEAEELVNIYGDGQDFNPSDAPDSVAGIGSGETSQMERSTQRPVSEQAQNRGPLEAIFQTSAAGQSYLNRKVVGPAAGAIGTGVDIYGDVVTDTPVDASEGDRGAVAQATETYLTYGGQAATGMTVGLPVAAREAGATAQSAAEFASNNPADESAAAAANTVYNFAKSEYEFATNNPVAYAGQITGGLVVGGAAGRALQGTRVGNTIAKYDPGSRAYNAVRRRVSDRDSGAGAGTGAGAGDTLGSGGSGSLLDPDAVDQARGVSGPSRTSRLRGRIERSDTAQRIQTEIDRIQTQFGDLVEDTRGQMGTGRRRSRTPRESVDSEETQPDVRPEDAGGTFEDVRQDSLTQTQDALRDVGRRERSAENRGVNAEPDPVGRSRSTQEPTEPSVRFDDDVRNRDLDDATDPTLAPGAGVAGTSVGQRTELAQRGRQTRRLLAGALGRSAAAQRSEVTSGGGLALGSLPTTAVGQRGAVSQRPDQDSLIGPTQRQPTDTDDELATPTTTTTTTTTTGTPGEPGTPTTGTPGDPGTPIRPPSPPRPPDTPRPPRDPKPDEESSEKNGSNRQADGFAFLGESDGRAGAGFFNEFVTVSGGGDRRAATDAEVTLGAGLPTRGQVEGDEGVEQAEDLFSGFDGFGGGDLL